MEDWIFCKVQNSLSFRLGVFARGAASVFYLILEFLGAFEGKGRGNPWYMVLKSLGTFEGKGMGNSWYFSCGVLVYRGTKLLWSSKKILKFMGNFEGKGREGGNSWYLVLKFLGAFEGKGRENSWYFPCGVLVYRDTKSMWSSEKNGRTGNLLRSIPNTFREAFFFAKRSVRFFAKRPLFAKHPKHFLRSVPFCEASQIGRMDLL